MENQLKKITSKFRSSSKSLSKPANLTVSAMLLALSIVLKYFENMSMGFLGTNLIKIGFSLIPIVAAAILYGPVVSGIIGGLNDIIGYLLAPQGAYIPGFTISMILVGVIYGVAFYKENVKLTRVIAAEVIITFLINILLGGVWFMVFYGFSLKKAFIIRGAKELIDLPISILIDFFLYKALFRIPEAKRIIRSSEVPET